MDKGFVGIREDFRKHGFLRKQYTACSIELVKDWESKLPAGVRK